ncbi:extracellular solute-binding protein [Acholeplasma laidlawii]|uniref:extracellular solute-binding protein n=1 Tax=Acholeplasma laidlawii TaxID=2148 RepID=UPI003F931BBC
MKKVIWIFFTVFFLTSCVNLAPEVKFEVDGGMPIDPIMFEDVDKLPIPIKEGFSFDGWYLDSDHHKELIYSTQISRNTTLYAKWAINQYTISFEVNGDTELESIVYDFEAVINLPILDKEGHVFQGWYLDSNFTNRFDLVRMPSKNITLFSKWLLAEYELNFYHEHQLLSSVTLAYNQEITINMIPTIPIIEGKSFDRWTLEIPNSMPANDVSVSTIYKITEYLITFIDYDGTILSEVIVKHNFDTPLPPTPNNHEGKLFLEWKGQTKNIISDGIVVALYSDLLTVSFETNGGFNIEDVQAMKGSLLTNLPIPLKPSHVFLGWYIDSDLTIEFNEKEILTEDIRLYAKFKSNEVTEIVIMHGAPYQVDPFDAAYSGREQQARQTKQREVESRLNVKVVYKAYPAAAAWGPDRINEIIKASVAGAPLADILWTTSDWTAQLANANAIVPVDKYLASTGTNITTEAKQLGTFKSQFYAFSANKPTVDVGLYFNIELVNDLGIENPAELYNNGEWTWSKFEQWAEAAKAALPSLGDGYKVLGGVRAVYAENMIPLNGGSLINALSGRVAFHQTPALETYSFLHGLYNKGLFEGTGTYDTGSPLWQSGKVVMHPGSFWFLNAENRWKNLAFDLGFVPYPSSDTYTGDYVSPIGGVAVYTL